MHFRVALSMFFFLSSIFFVHAQTMLNATSSSTGMRASSESDELSVATLTFVILGSIVVAFLLIRCCMAYCEKKKKNGYQQTPGGDYAIADQR